LWLGGKIVFESLLAFLAKPLEIFLVIYTY
jgi:hypothetical protein